MGKKFYLVSRCKKTLLSRVGGWPPWRPGSATGPLHYQPTFANSVQLSCNITATPKLPWISGQSPHTAHWLVSIQIGVYSIDSSWRRYQDICDNNNILYQIWMAEKVLLQHSNCFEKFPKNLFEAYF